MGDLLQGVIQNWASDLIKVGVMTIVTFGLARMNAKYPTWGSHARYALTIFVLLALLMFTFTGQAILSPQPITVPITTTNAESQIKTWVSSFGYGWTESPDNASYFRVLVTLKDNRQIFISRQRGYENALFVYETFAPNQQEEQIYSKMTPTQKSDLSHELRINIAALGVDYQGITTPLGAYSMQKLVQIDQTVTSKTVFDVLHSMDLATVVATETVAKALEDSHKGV